MNSVMIVSIIIAMITILLIVGAPIKPIQALMQGAMKLAIGALFLFFFNIVAASVGMHLPINVVTATIAGFLGIPGMISLTALHIFVFV
ncbi:inhibitor of the pro-sigma K processing machinery [Natronobacillus azotifigens]|uniref:Pro-sigmaK processing inhibitor BofA family protein n=1 Tax=Natronobacillus azotifigens TaxID=472978 RepID=A0A9J6RA48_9BACI|nr:pro-sigmaK processing inhibitor BofA family protein [Natronobacillus azotifigens]MCZ0702187.1 pro-sigmaK processing inhibitor BofA family protein [Natronobacillus azotifigens]